MRFDTVTAQGSLSDNIQIKSKILGYDLQYRVYLPDEAKLIAPLPTIYLTDGQWYLSEGKIVDILDREISAGNIKPVAAIFVDSRNPADLSENRRNNQFMCNQKYAAFFAGELLPEVEASFPVSKDRTDRVVGGLSFGGLNAGCFGIMLSQVFSGVAMQSPASTKHLKILMKLYNDRETLPIKIFMSAGTKKDNTRAIRKFKKLLIQKNYNIDYTEVPFGHSWKNWGPLIDDMLKAFFKGSKTQED